MLTFLKSVLRRKPALDPNARVVTSRPVADAAAPLPRVETTQLQLAAIIAKFPDDLKKLVSTPPPPDAMIALPLPTIRKYLATGSVKMSLASVARQAPAGTFAPLPSQEKRMVEVPLAEILKRVDSALLKVRDDQRLTSLATGDVDIFGDEANPRSLSPKVADENHTISVPTFPEAPVPAPRTLKMDMGAFAPAPASPPSASPAISPAARPELILPEAPLRIPVSKAPEAEEMPTFSRRDPQPLPAPAPTPTLPTERLSIPPAASGMARVQESKAPSTIGGTARDLGLRLSEISVGWPETITSQLPGVAGAIVALPGPRVAEGLAQGKVAFTWGELRQWITPAVPEIPGVSDEAEITIPLRVVAPAFLALTSVPKRKATPLQIDESIPDLFSDESAPPPAVASPPVAGSAASDRMEPMQLAPDHREEAPEPVEAFHFSEETSPAIAPQPADDALPVPFVDAPTVWLEGAPASEPTESFGFLEPSPAPREKSEVSSADPLEPAPAQEVISTPPPVTVEPAKALTAGEFLGSPEKIAWSPSELVSALVQRPDIEGAIVALQEGLAIAHDLPEGMRGEIFAAFLPQIFARLNQYGAEMQLGGVDDILINAGARQCRLIRRETLYFAVLAPEGDTLPLGELRLCADALTTS